ncbi:hypothetical protein H310_14047 [Aphanomyces invadans]|uniref:Uncharacterized protein n=1 Tax=Aphanomyces invadans TaxID=157072 RepID=A0A024TBF3_9STRA|nr:hypothetical protein H310_14047 [Aphanomyces invadans]ETV91368.1 hypothetical protein H310_14047 [Aphanomyces invadans]|eukprot:XP_008879996.1 hypothetical protein H310_14047 [Aphanomyces invadans]
MPREMTGFCPRDQQMSHHQSRTADQGDDGVNGGMLVASRQVENSVQMQRTSSSFVVATRLGRRLRTGRSSGGWRRPMACDDRCWKGKHTEQPQHQRRSRRVARVGVKTTQRAS